MAAGPPSTANFCGSAQMAGSQRLCLATMSLIARIFYRSGMAFRRFGRLFALSTLAVWLPACNAQPDASPDEETISCRDWMNLPADTRTRVMADRLGAEFGGPDVVPLGACLTALAQPVAERVYNDCLRADIQYDAASARAVSAAVDFCRAREAGSQR